MKPLIIAIAAASLLAAPAFAQEVAPSAAGAAKPASAATPNPAKRVFKVGQMVGNYGAANKYVIKNPTELGLETPGSNQRWLKIETNAYLIDTRNDTVLSVTPLKQ